ncbi:hypothetical protein JXR93_09925 [bacterium]|nr:hypothetical protein [bacterium]
MKNFILLFLILVFFWGCATEDEIAYNKIKDSNSIEELNSFVIHYPTHEKIEYVNYRLRVLEFQQIKKNPKPLYLRHFITRYKRGKDVDQLRDIWFEQRFSSALKSENRQKELENLHFDFPEKNFQDRIRVKIYEFDKEDILKSENYDEIYSFLKKYPTSDISIELQRKLERLELAKTLESNNLKQIEQFLNRNPQYLKGEVEYKYHKLLFEHYKDSSFDKIERFLENNPQNIFYNELKNIVIEKKYRWNLAFFEINQLLELDSVEKNEKFRDDIEIVKKNRAKFDKQKDILGKLLSEPTLDNDIELKIYEIPENSIDNGKLTIKLPFFVRDLSIYTKKIESKFILIYLSTLIALDLYYHQNIEANFDIFKEKIEFFSKIDDKYSLRKRLFFLFVMDDVDEFKKTLVTLTEKESDNIFFRFLRLYFFEEEAIENYLSELKRAADDSISIINSEKTIYQGRVDNSIELYFIDKIVKYILTFYREKKIILNQNIVDKISKIKIIGVNGAFDKEFCRFYNDLKSEKIDIFNKLKAETELKSELESYLFSNLPIKEIKRELTKVSTEKFNKSCFYNKNSSDWCKKKSELFNVLEFCNK